MSIIVGVGITCLMIGVLIGFIICALLTMGKIADQQAELMRQTEENLYGLPHPKFDKRA